GSYASPVATCLNRLSESKTWARNGLRRLEPGRILVPAPTTKATGPSAEGHFGHEQVVAARSVHVRVEDHHLAVRARLGVWIRVVAGSNGVVMKEQPRVAAVAAHDADGLHPDHRRPHRINATHERPLSIE